MTCVCLSYSLCSGAAVPLFFPVQARVNVSFACDSQPPISGEACAVLDLQIWDEAALFDGREYPCIVFLGPNHRVTLVYLFTAEPRLARFLRDFISKIAELKRALAALIGIGAAFLIICVLLFVVRLIAQRQASKQKHLLYMSRVELVLWSAINVPQPEDCHFATLPPDIVDHIIKYVRELEEEEFEVL